MIVMELGVISGLILKMKKKWNDVLKLLGGIAAILAAISFLLGMIAISVLKSAVASANTMMTSEIPSSVVIFIQNMNPVIGGLIAGIGVGIAFMIWGIIGALLWEATERGLKLVGINVSSK